MLVNAAVEVFVKFMNLNFGEKLVFVGLLDEILFNKSQKYLTTFNEIDVFMIKLYVVGKVRSRKAGSTPLMDVLTK